MTAFAPASRPTSCRSPSSTRASSLELVAQLAKRRVAAGADARARRSACSTSAAPSRATTRSPPAPRSSTRRARTLQSLLPIYRFIAWSRDNDFVSIRETLQKEKQQKRQKGLAKNDAVRIVRGMFAGKQGVVQEVDAKGGLRVLVGKVAVKLGAEDVQKA